jgi:hypothetical protein
MFDRFFHPKPFHCVLAKPGRDTEFLNEIAGRFRSENVVLLNSLIQAASSSCLQQL